MKALIFEAELDSVSQNIKSRGGTDNITLFTDAIKFVDESIECIPAYPNRDDFEILSIEQLQGYDYIFWSGGSLNAYDESDEVLRQIQQAKLVFASGVPFYGSCFGLQIAVMASGGMVGKNKNGVEAGVAENITPTKFGKNHPLLKDRSKPFTSYSYHNSETVKLPPNSKILASNNHSKVEAIEINYNGGTFWGVQYHPEFTTPAMRVEDIIYHEKISSPDGGIIYDKKIEQNKSDLEQYTVLTDIRNFIEYYKKS